MGYCILFVIRDHLFYRMYAFVEDDRVYVGSTPTFIVNQSEVFGRVTNGSLNIINWGWSSEDYILCRSDDKLEFVFNHLLLDADGQLQLVMKFGRLVYGSEQDIIKAYPLLIITKDSGVVEGWYYCKGRNAENCSLLPLQ